MHTKHQALFLRKIKVKKIKCRLLQFLLGALRVNLPTEPRTLDAEQLVKKIYNVNSEKHLTFAVLYL